MTFGRRFAGRTRLQPNWANPVQDHEGVGEREGGSLEGGAGGQLPFGVVVSAGVEERGDLLHLPVKCEVAIQEGDELRSGADGEGVIGEQPAPDEAFVGLLDGAGGALAEGLAQARRREQGDLPADVACDGVAGVLDWLCDVRLGGHGYDSGGCIGRFSQSMSRTGEGNG